MVGMLQEERPFPEPKWGSCLTLGNEETPVLTKQEILLGKGARGGEQEGKGTQENCSVTWLAVSGFMVMGLVSRSSLTKHSDSESFLVAHTLLSQDRCQREGFRVAEGHVSSPFDLSQTLLVDGGLLVPCSLPGPPVVKQLMQMVCLARVGGFSQCASPNRHRHNYPHLATEKEKIHHLISTVVCQCK